MWPTRTTFQKRNPWRVATGFLGARRRGVRQETRCRRPARGDSSGGRWTAGREAVKRSGTGEPPPGWPCGVEWAEDASDNEAQRAGWRGCCTGRRALVTATGILEAVLTAITFRRRPSRDGRSDSVVKCCRGYFPREHPGREGPSLLGKSWTEMQHYPAHVTCSRRT